MPAKSKKRIKPVIEEVVEEETAVEEKSEEQVSPAPVDENPETPDLPSEPVEKAPEEVSSKPDDSDNEAKEVGQAPKHAKMNLKLIIIITLISALVAAFVSGGVYVYLSGLENLNSKPENEVVLEPTSTPSPAPSASPEAQEEVDKSEYSVQVLNGSGAIGAASGGEDVLVEAGFTVEDTGNAGKYDYKTTVIQAKSNVPTSVIDEAQKALEDGDYEVEIGDELEATSDYDIVVIVGAS